MIAVQVTAAVSAQAGASGSEKPVATFSSALVQFTCVTSLAARAREVIFFLETPPSPCLWQH